MTEGKEFQRTLCKDVGVADGAEDEQTALPADGNGESADGAKKKKKREKFSVWLKRNRKKIVISLLSVLTAGVVLAAVLVPVHFVTLNDPDDFITMPVVKLPLSDAVTVEKSGSYIAHPDTVYTDDGNIIVMYPLGHGKGELAMRVSSDFGATWSDRVTGLPASFADSQETPTLYKLRFTDGATKLVMISGCPYWVATKYKANGFNFSYSDDNGVTWSEFENFYGTEWAGTNGKSAYDAIVAMSSLTQIYENGAPVDKWMGLFHDHSFNLYKTYLTFDADGNAQWSEPELVFGAGTENDNTARTHGMCEVEAIRVEGIATDSPYAEYNGAIILIGRTEKRTCRSLITVSTDEGATWSALKEVPYDLSGDRHKAEYDATTGKVLISFRQMIPVKHSAVSIYNRISNGWYAWVGTFEDLLSYTDDDAENDTAGDYLIELGRTAYFAKPYGAVIDNGYSGVVCVDGRFNVVGYGSFDEIGTTRYIISRTFTLAEIEALQ